MVKHIIPNFRATTFTKAFILNSLVFAITAVFTIEIRIQLNNKDSRIYKLLSQFSSFDIIPHYIKLLYTLLAAFLAAMTVYLVMFYIFGFGGGLLSDKIVRQHFV